MLSISKKGLIIGLGAGALALLISYVARLEGGVFVPELAAQTLFSLTPGWVEGPVVENLGPIAKYSTFVVAIFVNLFLYGALGVLSYKYHKVLPGKNIVLRTLSISFLSYLVFLVVGEILLASTRLLSQPTSPILLALYLLLPNLAFGAVLSVAYTKLNRAPSAFCEPKSRTAEPFNRKRRLVIKAGIAVAVAATLLYYGVGFLIDRQKTSTTLSSSAAESFFSQEITPNGRFYRVDGNIIAPDLKPSNWRLVVHGLVENPLSLSLDDLNSMQSVEQYNTLECVSNRIGGVLISTAKWKGVKLKDIFARAQVRPESVYILFRCSDNYDVGIPLETGLLDGTILVYEMNGQPLPKEHGYPIRAIVPGLYGMMNAKWIKEIELVNQIYEGFWQRLGWANDAKYNTASSVVIPNDSVNWIPTFILDESKEVMLGNPLPIAGIAFSGDRGISSVEVSTDGGRSWFPASLKDPLSSYTWVLWSAEWNPPGTGHYSITVRAVDKSGVVQTAELNEGFPGGATGYHVVDIKVGS